MKHLLLITVLMLLSSLSITAQESEKNDINKTTFGIVGGRTLYDFSPSKSTYTISDEYTSYYAGFFINKKLSNKFSLQLESLFLKGVNNQNQIEIPLKLHYSLHKKIDIYLGSQLNILTKKRSLYDRLGSGFNIGLQYAFSEKWFVDLRYVHRLSQEKSNPKPVSTPDGRIRGFRLGVGFRF